MTESARKLVFVDHKALAANPEKAIADGLSGLEPGQILVYRHASIRVTTKAMKLTNAIAARMADRFKMALVQWPTDRADAPSRKWCYGIQKPTRG